MAKIDPKLSEICQVLVYFQSGTISKHMILDSDMPTFVEATKRLHVIPGINPHTGGATAKVWKITVASFYLCGPYWWSTPDLQENYDSRGAHLIQEQGEEIVFIDNEYLDKISQKAIDSL